MRTALKIGFGILGLGLAYVLLTPKALALQPGPSPQPQPEPPAPPPSPPSPPAPPQISPGELAQPRDYVEVPVSYLYPPDRGGPPFRTSTDQVQLQANEHINNVILHLDNLVGPNAYGTTVGFTYSGPARSSHTPIPERIPAVFSRGAIVSVVRGNVRIA